MRRRKTTLVVSVPFLLGLVVCLVATPPAAAKDKTLLFLDCLSVDMNSGRSGSIEIGIERWSEPGEREALVTVLVEQGTDKLLKAVQKIKPRAGFVRTPQSLGWDIHFAQQTELASGGSRVVFVTDRPISGLEARQNNRSMDYQFMLAEVHLVKDGDKEKGTGTYVGAGKVSYDEKQKAIEVENYGQEPVRLSSCQVR
jgi:hypothetical protein